MQGFPYIYLFVAGSVDIVTNFLVLELWPSSPISLSHLQTHHVFPIHRLYLGGQAVYINSR